MRAWSDGDQRALDGLTPIVYEELRRLAHRYMVALDDAMTAVARLDPRKSQIIEMRFFGGLSAEETAEALIISPATVRRDWSIAKLWLYRELFGGANHGL